MPQALFWKKSLPISLSLWVNLTEGLYETMDGEAMGIMFALIIDIAQGYSVTDIQSIQCNQSGNNFSLKLPSRTNPTVQRLFTNSDSLTITATHLCVSLLPQGSW
jgi:hypothetical protein